MKGRGLVLLFALLFLAGLMAACPRRPAKKVAPVGGPLAGKYAKQLSPEEVLAQLPTLSVERRAKLEGMLIAQGYPGKEEEFKQTRVFVRIGDPDQLEDLTNFLPGSTLSLSPRAKYAVAVLPMDQGGFGFATNPYMTPPMSGTFKLARFDPHDSSLYLVSTEGKLSLYRGGYLTKELDLTELYPNLDQLTLGHMVISPDDKWLAISYTDSQGEAYTDIWLLSEKRRTFHGSAQAGVVGEQPLTWVPDHFILVRREGDGVEIVRHNPWTNRRFRVYQFTSGKTDIATSRSGPLMYATNLLMKDQQGNYFLLDLLSGGLSYLAPPPGFMFVEPYASAFGGLVFYGMVEGVLTPVWLYYDGEKDAWFRLLVSTPAELGAVDTENLPGWRKGWGDKAGSEGEQAGDEGEASGE